jgi:hypothetical protein
MLRGIPSQGFLAVRPASSAFDEKRLNLRFFDIRGDEHHLRVGDLEYVAAIEERGGPPLQDDVIQPYPIPTIDADAPGTGPLTIEKYFRVQPGHELAWTQVDVHLRQRTGGYGNGA